MKLPSAPNMVCFSISAARFWPAAPCTTLREGVAQCKKIGGVDGAEEVSSVISFGLPREHYGVEGAGGGVVEGSALK